MADPLTTRDLAGTPGASVEDAEPADEPTGNENEVVEKPAMNHPSGASGEEESAAEGGPPLPSDQTERFTDRWREIQTGFVDRPRESVEQADALVADLMQRLAASFSNERERLEAEWDAGDDVSTEDLRVVLTRYRSFFDRLLSA